RKERKRKGLLNNTNKRNLLQRFRLHLPLDRVVSIIRLDLSINPTASRIISLARQLVQGRREIERK
ncbi:hypothetical protein CSUI_006494, partial [Cystoisospora suis]